MKFYQILIRNIQVINFIQNNIYESNEDAQYDIDFIQSSLPTQQPLHETIYNDNNPDQALTTNSSSSSSSSSKDMKSQNAKSYINEEQQHKITATTTAAATTTTTTTTTTATTLSISSNPSSNSNSNELQSNDSVSILSSIFGWQSKDVNKETTNTDTSTSIDYSINKVRTKVQIRRLIYKK